MLILAIESSCDETAAAVVRVPDAAASDPSVLNTTLLEVRSNVVSSQANLHAETGGVVPEVAARAHLAAAVPVVRRALADAEAAWPSIDAIAATAGPGLPGALVVGFNLARGLAYARGLPLIPTDHIEGHVCANWLAVDGLAEPPPLPALALVVSGGHTELLLMADDGSFERLGGTRDDAAGEAFDKVARLLDLPYPGGPPISKLAATYEPRKGQTRLPRAWLRGTDDFSFSGLKTAVAQLVARPADQGGSPPPAEVAWAFQESVADVLARKTAQVAAREGVASVLVAGGVAANGRLRERVAEACAEVGLPVFVPPPRLCTDNAAMIAAAAARHLDAAVPPEAELDIFSTRQRHRRIRPPRADSASAAGGGFK